MYESSCSYQGALELKRSASATCPLGIKTEDFGSAADWPTIEVGFSETLVLSVTCTMFPLDDLKTMLKMVQADCGTIMKSTSSDLMVHALDSIPILSSVSTRRPIYQLAAPANQQGVANTI
ncbi:unnamed protein product [Phaedon cochleariae]|uniref:Uncharacterized protein n=1 Tax=Phaedon cochleariae TaxID=80249 RepID=A0A9N9SBC3_PHACE|nr:unnamed protein product [Phaedon cochleariae]